MKEKDRPKYPLVGHLVYVGDREGFSKHHCYKAYLCSLDDKVHVQTDYLDFLPLNENEYTLVDNFNLKTIKNGCHVELAHTISDFYGSGEYPKTGKVINICNGYLHILTPTGDKFVPAGLYKKMTLLSKIRNMIFK